MRPPHVWQEIDFSYCYQFGNEHLLALVPITPTLQILLLRGTPVSDEGFANYFRAISRQAKGPSRLEVLDVSTVTKADSLLNRITDGTVELVSTHCPDLTCLQLDWCRGVTDQSCQALTRLLRLTDLGLFLTSITSAGCQHLAKLSKLQKLDISATRMSIESSSSLTEGDSQQEESAGTCLDSLFPDRHESSLRELRIRFHKSLTEEILVRIAYHAPHLELLDIRYCDLSRDEAKEAFRTLQRRGVQILADPISSNVNNASNNHGAGNAV